MYSKNEIIEKTVEAVMSQFRENASAGEVLSYYLSNVDIDNLRSAKYYLIAREFPDVLAENENSYTAAYMDLGACYGYDERTIRMILDKRLKY